MNLSIKRSTSAEAKLSLFQTVIPIKLHLRSDLHLARKVWHMSMGMLVAGIYASGLDRSTGVVILACFLGLNVVVETARLNVPAFNEKVLKYWGPLMRSSEVNRMSGVPYYIAASMIAVGIFPKPVAILAVLYLALGDPLASLGGILFGHKGPRYANGKSLIGTGTGVVTCLLVSYFYLASQNFSGGSLWLLTLVGGLAGGLAELLPFEVDDNFSIPVVSGFVLWLAYIVVGF